MKKIISILIPILLLGFRYTHSTSSYDIDNVYSGIECDTDTKVLTSYGNLEEAETILVPTSLKSGKYVVKISEKATNLYYIEDTKLYIEAPYCYKSVYYEEVILIIDNKYGITTGKLIFE
jgi:hypothetical protein